MLDVQDKEYFQTVKDFAAKVGKAENLQQQLDYLDTYAENGTRGRSKCVLMKDFAPYSFYFVMYVKDKEGTYQPWFNGGCIFHGQIDDYGSGAAPTFSVTLTPTDGWSIHT